MFIRIRKRLERWGVQMISWVANRLSRKSALNMAVFLANVSYIIVANFKRVAYRNMEIAYGEELPDSKKDEYAREAIRTLAKTMIDFVRFKQYSKDDLKSLAKRVEGLEHLTKALEDSPGGVIGIASHLGSWEFSGAWLLANGIPLSAVGKEQPDAGVTKMMLELREGVGIQHISRTKKGNKAIIKALNSKTVLGLISDQNGGRDGIFVPFFGTMASCAKGPAQLAMKKKVPVLMISALWEGFDYIIEISPPLELVDTGDPEADLYENTFRCQAAIEKVVRKYPGQWLWGHRRWKTRPPGEESLYSV